MDCLSIIEAPQLACCETDRYKTSIPTVLQMDLAKSRADNLRLIHSGREAQRRSRYAIPKHTFGTKRCPGEKNYYETFNRNNVRLVDLRETPIKKITHTGIETGDGLHELDVIIYATGFHSVTGELLRLDIRGQHGRSLQEHWSDGPRTNLGVQFSGFPNLWAIMGPHNPAVFCNIPRCVETRRVDRRLPPLYARKGFRDDDRNRRSRRRMDQALLRIGQRTINQ